MDWVEPAAIFGLIMGYIWGLRFVAPWSWIAIPAAMIASHALRRESPAWLGFRMGNLGDCLRRLAPAVAVLALLMLGTALLCGTLRAVAWRTALAGYALYLPWGVVQQYALNGYFLNRLDRAASPRTAPVLATALFCAVHLPNWFLMVVALAAGLCCTWLYRRWRNLLALGLAHGTVGFLLYQTVPDSISHHLRVGWGWFR